MALQKEAPVAGTVEEAHGAQVLLHQYQLIGSVPAALVVLARVENATLAGSQFDNDRRAGSKHHNNFNTNFVSTGRFLASYWLRSLRLGRYVLLCVRVFGTFYSVSLFCAWR